jgi:hypothetical protein
LASVVVIVVVVDTGPSRWFPRLLELDQAHGGHILVQAEVREVGAPRSVGQVLRDVLQVAVGVDLDRHGGRHNPGSRGGSTKDGVAVNLLNPSAGNSDRDVGLPLGQDQRLHRGTEWSRLTSWDVRLCGSVGCGVGQDPLRAKCLWLQNPLLQLEVHTVGDRWANETEREPVAERLVWMLQEGQSSGGDAELPAHVVDTACQDVLEGTIRCAGVVGTGRVALDIEVHIHEQWEKLR